MYDPTIGRWFTEDPIGFDGGDANLYRYVGNNSTDEIDPSGKIGIFIDGYMYAKEDHTIIGAIYNAYPGRENVKKFYYTPSAGNLDTIVSDAMKKIERARKNNKDEPIDIFGWSRGSMTAVALANRLAEQKIQVRFLGVIDPSYPLKQLETKELRKAAEAPLQDNVQSAAVFYRSGRGDGAKEKALFGPTRIPKLDKNNKNTKFVRSYRDPRHPNLDHLGTGFSRAFGYDMWKAALAAKVPLPAIDESVFASKEKWSSKPHGGVLERIRENEQKQVEDYRRGGGMPFPIPKNEDGKPFGIPPDMQEDK